MHLFTTLIRLPPPKPRPTLAMCELTNFSANVQILTCATPLKNH